MKKLEFLFPELCTIYGECYNVKYLARCNNQIEVTETRLTDMPLFAGGAADMVYLGSLTESGQEKAIAYLMNYKTEIQELINRGTVFLVTGNAIECFGSYIDCNDIAKAWTGREAEASEASGDVAGAGSRRIEALGLFDFHSVRKINAARHNSMFLGSFDADDGKIELLGHKSQFSFSYYDGAAAPMMQLPKGVGMNPQTTDEGVRRNNFFATYSLGPFAVQNPYLVKFLLRKLDLDDGLCYEDAAIASYEDRLVQYKEFLGLQDI